MGLLLTNAAAGGGINSSIIMVVYIVVIVGFIYFFMIRPQRKEQGRMKDMLGSLEVGDTVCTSSGFYGMIIDIEDDTVIVEFGSNKKCRITMKKEAIVQVEKPEDTAADTDKKNK